MKDNVTSDGGPTRRSVLLKGGAVAAAGAVGLSLLGSSPAGADTTVELNVYGVTHLLVENVDVATFEIEDGTKAYLSAQTNSSEDGFYSGTDTTVTKDDPQPSDEIFLLIYSFVGAFDAFPTTIGNAIVLPGAHQLFPNTPVDAYNAAADVAADVNIADGGVGFDGISPLVTAAGEFSGETDGLSQVSIDFGRAYNGVVSTLFTLQTGDEIVDLQRTNEPSTSSMTLDVSQGGTPVGSGIAVVVDWLVVGW